MIRTILLGLGVLGAASWCQATPAPLPLVQHRLVYGTEDPVVRAHPNATIDQETLAYVNRRVRAGEIMATSGMLSYVLGLAGNPGAPGSGCPVDGTEFFGVDPERPLTGAAGGRPACCVLRATGGYCLLDR